MKLLFRNQAYRLLTLSRFFNAFGASIFNLVFIVYASTLPQASFAVAMANIVMILPTFFTVFVGIRAHYTRDKVKWMVYSGLFQAVLFFLAALVVQQASLFAFSSLCLINVISDVISDFAGGLRMPLILNVSSKSISTRKMRPISELSICGQKVSLIASKVELRKDRKRWKMLSIFLRCLAVINLPNTIEIRPIVEYLQTKKII